MGEAASGDYPVDVYLLDAANAPQSRRSLVLRVEPGAPARLYRGAQPELGERAARCGRQGPCHGGKRGPCRIVRAARSRARRLLAEGDIAGARLLLFHLAELGEGDAAYELARTFDAEMLAKLGASGVDSDQATRARLVRAGLASGNAEAARRLKILASLSVSDPSD